MLHGGATFEHDCWGEPQAELGMQQLANNAGIKFDYGVLAQWQPVDSQRLLLWAGQRGQCHCLLGPLCHLMKGTQQSNCQSSVEPLSSMFWQADSGCRRSSWTR